MDKEELILRKTENFKSNLKMNDILSIERTILANERTALSYIRTFIGILGSGIGLLKLFNESKLLYYIGISAMIFSVFALVQGIRRYIIVRKTTSEFEKLIRLNRKKV
ncbi:MAG: DUF202 domain-containing protein [Andreesenia angusta]|nr:DUF202 domain-containing protein [Andreesenia angusta]